MLSAIGLDAYVAAVTGLWFVLAGIEKVRPAPRGGRRSIPYPRWRTAISHIRGLLEFLGGVAVLILAAAGTLGFPAPAYELYLGLGLAVLALMSVVESVLPPVRWVFGLYSLLGFAIAVFYAGFRN
ncbi:MAG: hypothetical protein K4304_02405 [Propionicimonas sp.]|jgi:hypothetical protein